MVLPVRSKSFLKRRTALAADLLDQLHAAARTECCNDPNWKTVAEWAVEMNYSRSHMLRLLEAGVNKGVMLKENRRKPRGNGSYPTPCYRAVQRKGK